MDHESEMNIYTIKNTPMYIQYFITTKNIYLCENFGEHFFSTLYWYSIFPDGYYNLLYLLYNLL